ncbi:MAG: triose-phosphate isomerase [Candidatus Omnitrophota bacterium]
MVREAEMRKTIIAGNWKMHKTVGEALELVNGLKRGLYSLENVELVVCPGFTLLDEVGDALSGSDISLGAQNVHWQEEGAFTGEVCARQLKDIGARYVIVGHSERRHIFGEDDTTVNNKLKAVLAAGMSPILCLGETLSQREADETFKVIEEQVTRGLAGVNKQGLANSVIAYEPVWAIGTGKTASPQQAQEVHSFIRGQICRLYDAEAAQGLRIQYGGSVKPDNIVALIREEDIDGALVGGASLDVDAFCAIARQAAGF